MFDGYNIEIVGGINLLKRVFGSAYDLYLTNCEEYIKKQLSTGAQESQAHQETQQDARTPSEMLTANFAATQVNNHADVSTNTPQ